MWKVNRRQTPSDGKSSRCLWQAELKKMVSHYHLIIMQFAAKYYTERKICTIYDEITLPAIHIKPCLSNNEKFLSLISKQKHIN
jgi:hypothetical protein